MYEIQGKYTSAKVFTEVEDIDVTEQILAICNHPIFTDCKIRIMPDCHRGKGCTIGFTSTMPQNREIIPNIIGVAVRQYSRAKVEALVLEKLRNSMLAFKKVQFDYPTNKGNRRITLNPYGVIISDKYYLVGFNEYVNDLRLYKVDKISNLEVLDEYFEKDEEFSLQDFCNKSFSIYQEQLLNITLEFDKSVAEDVLNYHFHPTQKMKQLENSNVQVKFISGWKYAICHELFKWGCNVQIKKPIELKNYYKQYLSDVLNNL